MSSMAAIPQNYKKNVEWIIGAYQDAGVSFANGFQKDAIQNAAGARKKNNWENWSCDISYVKNKKGTFIVVEDSGTVGLTGKNISTEEINKIMAEDKYLEPEERLARFTSMFNSGGNDKGGGLFGAGKSVYSVASEECTYYFDSLREDGKYVANINESGRVMEIAYEGNKAKEYILKETGLSPKITTGTRIIIKSPKKELVKSILDGEIIPFIQESWWLIIQRLGKNSKISVNGKSVEVPQNIKAGSRVFELKEKRDEYANGYNVKHFGLYIFEDGKNPWKGISYYRKGMKIGEIDLKDIPEKVKDKFWGYIEVEKDWETELAEIEDKVHFGVSKGKKNCIAYQNIKNYCNQKLKEKFIEWGFIKDKESQDKKLNDEIKKIAEDLQDLFDKLGFEDLGKGNNKADFDVRWKNIKYPVYGTEKVTTGDIINYNFIIKSTYATDKKFDYKLYVYNPKTGKVVSKIEEKRITVKSNSNYKRELSHKITKENSEQYEENRIILSVKAVGSNKKKEKELTYFYDIDRKYNNRSDREVVNLSLHECLFPSEGSKRVNFDEKINKVCYRIENKRNQKLHYKLNVSIHNANDATCPKIEDIISLTGEVKPFEEVKTEYIEEIILKKSLYEQYLSEGILELRARLIANENDEQFEKGDKIASSLLKIFLNRDDKKGKNDAFNVNSIDAPQNYKRSWITPGSNRTIFLNVGHVAYRKIEDYPEIQYNYLREQMLKQYVLLYLAEGRYDMFTEENKNFTELEPQEAVEQVIEKIENIYAKSLN